MQHYDYGRISAAAGSSVLIGRTAANIKNSSSIFG
jgi:hypothetical protein